MMYCGGHGKTLPCPDCAENLAKRYKGPTMTNQTEQQERERLVAAIKKHEAYCRHYKEYTSADLLKKAATMLAADSIPPAPHECKTEDEKKAYAFGWWKALETQSMAADKAASNSKNGPSIRIEGCNFKGLNADGSPPVSYQEMPDGTFSVAAIKLIDWELRGPLLYSSEPTYQPDDGPLTEEQIQDLLKIGNPSEEECRLIRLGWDAAHGIKGES